MYYRLRYHTDLQYEKVLRNYNDCLFMEDRCARDLLEAKKLLADVEKAEYPMADAFQHSQTGVDAADLRSKLSAIKLQTPSAEISKASSVEKNTLLIDTFRSRFDLCERKHLQASAKRAKYEASLLAIETALVDSRSKLTTLQLQANAESESADAYSHLAYGITGPSPHAAARLAAPSPQVVVC
ncbi:hypothetical protein DXG01_015547 [Tephrocybe rancida]|nr:hypothetical protein DXG01_015547 [Tephrocybe rancida]